MHFPDLLRVRRCGFAARLVPMLAALSLCACGTQGPSTLPATPSGSQPAQTVRIPATIIIKIPAPSSSSGRLRTPRYVSSATRSMRVTVVNHADQSAVSDQTVDLTPTSQGCASTLASTQCTLTLALAPGAYDAAISTFDGTGGSGTVLSRGQLVNFTIVPGTANQILLALSGIPHRVRVTSFAPGVRGSQFAGFTQYGVGALPFAIAPLDGDGNFIVGPGAPTFAVALTSGAGYTITSPVPTAPNTFSLTPPGSEGQTAGFSVTALFADDTCAQPGAVCTSAFSVKNHLQKIFVSGATGTFPMTLGTVLELTPPFTGSPVAMALQAPPLGVALDGGGNVFALTANSTVQRFAPPYTGAATTFGSGLFFALTLAVDGGGTVFVGDFKTSVKVYVPPYSAAPAVISDNVNGPQSLALDAGGNLYVGDYYGLNVTIYAPPYTGAATVISTLGASPTGIALDAAGDLFVANGINTVQVFSPPYTSAPLIVSNGVSFANYLTVDADGNLFVANAVGGTVTIYAPPYTGSPIVVHTPVSINPGALAVDLSGDLYVANKDTGTVTMFSPPYTGAGTTVTNALSSASGIVIAP
jgi:sugar lactone lactonase YvrE